MDGLFKQSVNWSVAATWNGTMADRPTSMSLTAGFSSKRSAALGFCDRRPTIPKSKVATDLSQVDDPVVSAEAPIGTARRCTAAQS